MSDRNAENDVLVEPSWTTAVSEPPRPWRRMVSGVNGGPSANSPMNSSAMGRLPEG